MYSEDSINIFQYQWTMEYHCQKLASKGLEYHCQKLASKGFLFHW
jgi:hypothetical protein